MWFYAPQKWYEVPGWLWAVWTARAPVATTRHAETPSRPATMQPWGTPTRSRPSVAESVERIRVQVDLMRPEKCCRGEVMIAGGKRHDVCSEDCQWQELDLLIANASVDAA